MFSSLIAASASTQSLSQLHANGSNVAVPRIRFGHLYTPGGNSALLGTAEAALGASGGKAPTVRHCMVLLLLLLLLHP